MRDKCGLKNIILNSLSGVSFKSVRINEKLPPEFLKLIIGEIKNLRKNNYFFEIDGIPKQQIANFVFLLRTLDFRLWEYPENWLKAGQRGFSGLMNRLKTLFQADFLKIRFQDFKKIISPYEDIKLAGLRFKIFKQSLDWLEKWDGDFRNYFLAHRKPTDFVFNLFSLAKFKDYVGRKPIIYFLKPNQLLYAEYILAFKDYKKYADELTQLTVFSDYVLPQILMHFNVLKLTPPAIRIINQKKLIKKNSNLEIELRAATILAGEMIRKKLKIGNSYEIDFALWNLKSKIKSRFNHFRNKTIFY